METMTLEPCPFCGGSTVDRLKVTGRCIECLGCGASGPELPREADREALIRAWNRRAQPAQAVDVGAIREVIVRLNEIVEMADRDPDEFYSFDLDEQADKLTRALSVEKAGPVGDGYVVVPRVELSRLLTDISTACDFVGSRARCKALADRLSERAALVRKAVATSPAPSGWKLAPIEPTWDMRNEARELLIDGLEKEPERLAYVLWKAMLSASPTPDKEGK